MSEQCHFSSVCRLPIYIHEGADVSGADDVEWQAEQRFVLVVVCTFSPANYYSASQAVQLKLKHEVKLSLAPPRKKFQSYRHNLYSGGAEVLLTGAWSPSLQQVVGTTQNTSVLLHLCRAQRKLQVTGPHLSPSHRWCVETRKHWGMFKEKWDVLPSEVSPEGSLRDRLSLGFNSCRVFCRLRYWGFIMRPSCLIWMHKV